MKIAIDHQLNYKYTGEVYLMPHLMYLYPRLSATIQLNNYEINISPKPSQVSKIVDIEGNTQLVAFFKNKTKQLHISAKMEIETELYNPFDFVYFPFEASLLPFTYSVKELEILAPYLVKDGVTTLIDQTARQIAAAAEWKTTSFLTGLSNYIATNFKYEIREEGAPMPAEETLIGKSGSCRDYSVLFIACCKALGLASRFVSGYLFSETLQHFYLHAWVEVYLPGGGWRGFDPTQNNVSSGLHIALATSIHPDNISPVKGMFRGSARSNLSSTLTLTKLN
jgi:transglutaminase-like putative cysteine protease